jgi:hypothetical protein
VVLAFDEGLVVNALAVVFRAEITLHECDLTAWPDGSQERR